MRPLDWGRFTPDQKLRGIMVAMRWKIIHCPTKCGECGSDVYLSQRRRGDVKGHPCHRYVWACGSGRHTCGWQSEIASRGVLSQVRPENYLSFFLFVVMMKEEYRMEKVYEDLSAYVFDHKVVDSWKHLYWRTLSACLRRSTHPNCGISVGGPMERVVFDEGNCGTNVGIRKGPQQPHGRTVAQTKWKPGFRATRQWRAKGGVVQKILKKPASKSTPLKRPSAATRMALKAGTQFDERTKGSCWIFCAV